MVNIVLLMSSYVNARAITLIALLVHLSDYKRENQAPGDLVKLYKGCKPPWAYLGSGQDLNNIN